MAIYNPSHNAVPIVNAARQWAEDCLVKDRSMFSDKSLWTVENLEALDTWFIQRPDVGEGTFYEKLKGQVVDAPPVARQLMAEALWALFLFPSKTSVTTKRSGILQVWSWSDEELDSNHPLLNDTVLRGIGSGGPGLNLYRWRELAFIINLATACKSRPESERRAVFENYDRFVSWIPSVPVEGHRQFRHILRYFLFADRVERMSSNKDRREVLVGFRRGERQDLRDMDDVELDRELYQLRQELEEEHGTSELDFYVPPLRGVWKPENEGDEDVQDGTDQRAGVAEAGVEYVEARARPRNLILYGPPGTGKTYRLQQLFSEYTDQPADVERSSWEQELLSGYGWRPVIVAALAAIGEPVKVQQVVEHPLTEAKAKQRGRKGNVRPTLWGYLQAHTPSWVSTVQVSARREPGVFTKNEDSEWSLTEDWRDHDGEAAELADKWSQGPGANAEPVKRYRVVTFHPSYSYEDFIVGLKPVEVENPDSDSGGTSFRMVPGVLKQLCAIAKANPLRRYALFVDEINRANIAKVFGELITLVEPDKRARYDADGRLLAGMEVQLPGMEGEDGRFGVPENLDIYGTMNTADRSIALLDIALRRRFEFEEMPPRYKPIDLLVEGVNLAGLLRVINDRLECLLDRDHRIGHAYFIKVSTLDELRAAFARQIIPLLQEYFFDDWSRIVLVLANRGGQSPFVKTTTVDLAALFGRAVDGLTGSERYEVTQADTWAVSDFQSIYQTDLAATDAA